VISRSRPRGSVTSIALDDHRDYRYARERESEKVKARERSAPTRRRQSRDERSIDPLCRPRGVPLLFIYLFIYFDTNTRKEIPGGNCDRQVYHITTCSPMPPSSSIRVATTRRRPFTCGFCSPFTKADRYPFLPPSAPFPLPLPRRRRRLPALPLDFKQLSA